MNRNNEATSWNYNRYINFFTILIPKYFIKYFFFVIHAVSDRCSSGETEDKSGQVLYDLVTKYLYPASITRALIPDDVDKIEVCV